MAIVQTAETGRDRAGAGREHVSALSSAGARAQTCAQTRRISSSLFVSRLPGTAAQPTMGASRQAATRHFVRIRARTRRARRAAGRAVPAEYPGLVGVNVNALHTV
ncbi:MAG: hypothetical protein ACPIOQ_05025 [Promethearchaeia archaeon]